MASETVHRRPRSKDQLCIKYLTRQRARFSITSSLPRNVYVSWNLYFCTRFYRRVPMAFIFEKVIKTTPRTQTSPFLWQCFWDAKVSHRNEQMGHRVWCVAVRTIILGVKVFVTGDVVYAEAFGRGFVFLNALGVANNLMDKRSAIYSDRPRMVRHIKPTYSTYNRQRDWLLQVMAGEL